MVAWRTFNIWRTFLFHKRLFVVKEGSSDYKKVERDGSLKDLWLNGSFLEPKMVILLLCCDCEEPFGAPFIFKSVCVYRYR